MADISNQDHSAHSNIVGQPNNLQLISLKRPFAGSEMGTPTLCLTKLRVTVGGEVDLPWDKALSKEPLLSWHPNTTCTGPFTLGYIFA